MTEMVIVKGEDGKLAGLGEKHGRAYAKFKREIEKLEIGETLMFGYRFPRSIKHHGYFFKKMTALFDRQERFEDFDRFRSWLTVGAGYADLVPGYGGCLVALPQSLAFWKMDEFEFVDLHQKIATFLWMDEPRAFLWPHLDPYQTYDTIELWHLEFERH